MLLVSGVWSYRTPEMRRIISLEALESTVCPILAVDTDGRVCFCNAAAAALLACAAHGAQGRLCWEVARMRRGDGSLFCHSECAVQKTIQRGKSDPPRVLCLRRGGVLSRVELLTVPIESMRHPRSALLHILRPLPGNQAVLAAKDSFDILSVSPDLYRLTPRERDVLRLLASGSRTSVIAQRLSMSSTTVRNHVQNILHRLQVHSRVEAVLIALGKAR